MKREPNVAMMSVLRKITPCHFVIPDGSSRIEIRYHATGCQSGWGVYADGSLIEQRPGFTEARSVALGLAAGQ